jgi:hypothetical protein
MVMTVAPPRVDPADPLKFEFRELRMHRDIQQLFAKRFKAASENIDALLGALARTDAKTGVPIDEKLSICTGLWGQFPDKRPVLAAIAIKALAAAFDSDIERAEALKAFIPNVEADPELKQALTRIRAAARAKQSYYFRTRYQARDIARLKRQLFHANTKPFSKDATFICIGSCFAINIGLALATRGVPNVSAIRYQDDTDPLSILNGVLTDAQFKHDVSTARSCVVILTAGFAESLGKFLTPEEISRTIIKMNATLKTWNASVRLLVTVSPVPLKGTSSGLSAYEANAISKSIIRLGVEQARQEGVEYFPSYELVTQHFVAMGVCPVGVDDGEPSHVNRDVILFITDLFIDHYLPWIDTAKPIQEDFTIPIREIGPRAREAAKTA